MEAQISVRRSLSDAREVLPDTVYHGVIRVKNETDEPQTIRVYQAEYGYNHEGENYFPPPGTVRSFLPVRVDVVFEYQVEDLDDLAA